MNRCSWVGYNKPHYEHYHDTEWGVSVHDDQKHFEMLILEGAQAGLSWETIIHNGPKALSDKQLEIIASVKGCPKLGFITGTGQMRPMLIRTILGMVFYLIFSF